MKFFYIFTFFITFNVTFLQCTKPSNEIKNKPVLEQVKKEPVTFLIYGELAPMDYAKPKDSMITLNYGFKLERIAGCDITADIERSVIQHNQKGDSILLRKIGENWKEEFEQKESLKLSFPL